MHFALAALEPTAVDTYFDSKRRGEMKEQTGKTNKHRKQCVRDTRIATKLDHRLKALKAKKSYSKQLKLKLQRILTKEFMSSDESDTDDNGEKIFLTKAIPWQSDTLTKYKRELDQKYETAIQSEQAKRQSIKRALDIASALALAFPARCVTTNL
ncbi:hypothetical protein Bbelb_187030 [Branchiostoma belcheri]|nr:hypothetical protein Bbelb_187030 [Branchiostoma belcheri]